MAKDALRSKRERIFQDKTNRGRGDGMATLRCMDGRPHKHLISSETSQEPLSLDNEPYEESDKTEIYSAAENRHHSRNNDEFSSDGRSMGSRRIDFGEYKQRWRRVKEGHEYRTLSERHMRTGAEKDTETSCWDWQSENMHRKYGADRYHSSNAAKRHNVNIHTESEFRTRSAFPGINPNALHARRERFCLQENESTGAFYRRRETHQEEPYDTRSWSQNYRRKGACHKSPTWSPARETRWGRKKKYEWDTSLLRFGKDRCSMPLADYNGDRSGHRETLCYDYGQIENHTDDSMVNWYNQDTPASKFEFIKQFLATEKLKGIVEELESEFNSKAAEVENLKGKHSDVTRSLENERKKVSKLKDLCRDRVLKERSIFQERIRELSEKVKKYKAYVEKMRSRT